MRKLAMVAMVAAVAGCAGGGGRSGEDAGASLPIGEGEGDVGGEGEGEGLDGAALYALHCASCHGALGEGGSGPAVAGWDAGLEALVDAIDGVMPLGTPADCSRGCPDAVARYILTLPPPAGHVCDPSTEAPGPAVLRLLTKAELDASVRDLFEGDGAACTTEAQCSYGRESCVDGACARDLCGTATFSLDAAAAGHASATRVHVAGDMNGWPSTSAAAGAFAMHKLPGTSTWLVKAQLTPGAHQYKIVVDDGAAWLADPRRAATSPDGFGGSNSVVTVACDGAPGAGAFDRAWSEALPAPSHPAAFPFDDHADSGLVSSVLLDEALAMADRAAALAVVDLEHLLGCDAAIAGCVEAFVDDLGRRAFRRPLSADERARLLGLVHADSDVREGLRLALAAVLSSPSFLYRSEVGPDGQGGLLTADETAAALSYFLWRTTPDRALLDAAAAGALDDADGRELQARRLLDDPRARQAIAAFAVQWLGVSGVTTVEKNAALGGFPAELRSAMLEEARQVVAHAALDDGGRFGDLMTGRSTFANGALAQWYGIGGVASSSTSFSLVPLPGERSGVLTLGAVLAVQAYPDQTSPVRRGLFVRRRLLCEELGTPPPNAGAIPEVDPSASTRERFEQHRDNAQCFACHQYIDDIGFGFERFDPIGRVRADDNGHPIDDSGDVTDLEGLGSGTHAPFASVPELGAVLADSARAPQCFVSQVFRYAHGRFDEAPDACALERLSRRFADSGGDIKELMIDVVRDDSFVQRALRGAP